MSTVDSNAFRVEIAAASALGALAASMSSGQWATFTMGGLDASIFHGNGASDQTMGEFAGKMQWDALHKRLVFAGTSHTGGAVVAGSGGLAYWDDATNQWTRESCSWNSDAEGHQYAHLAVDTSGNLYRRNFNSTTVKKRVWGNTGCSSWQTGLVANIGGDYFNQVSGGLEWFPNLNGGSGGLVFVDNGGANWTNAALTSWSTQSGDSISGAYDNNIAYANGFVYWGGGQGSTAFYRLSPTGTVTSMPAFPFSPGTNVGGGYMIPSANGLGVFLIAQGANGSFRYFNGSAWTTLSNHQIPSSPHLAGSIPDYGVMVTITIDPSGVATPVVKVYKQ